MTDDYEKAVLGAALSGYRELDTIARTLKAEDFYQPRHGQIWTAILGVFEAGMVPDHLTVRFRMGREADALPGGATYLIGLAQECPVIASAGFYAEQVAQIAAKRRVREIGNSLTQASDTDMAADAMIELAKEKLDSLGTSRTVKHSSPAQALVQVIDIAQHGTSLGTPTRWYELNHVISGWFPGQLITVGGRPGTGKALALNTPLPTPNGWTSMGDVKVNDMVIGADGCPTRVLAATEIMHGRPCYEIEFDDGSVIVADAEHQWSATSRADRRLSIGPSIRTTQEMSEDLRVGGSERRANYAVAIAAPVNLPDQDLVIDPYVLGCWLGDGDSNGGGFTTADPEILDAFRTAGLLVTKSPATYRYRLSYPKPTKPDAVPGLCAFCGSPLAADYHRRRYCNHTCARRGAMAGNAGQPRYQCVTCGCELAAGHTGLQCRGCRELTSLSGRLRLAGVLNDKHIPGNYLRASEPQRFALLQGLMDTDGTIGAGGRCSFDVTSERLAVDTYELAVSLGLKPTMKTRPVKGRTATSSICYRVGFTTNRPVFRLTRKLARVPVKVRAAHHRFVVAIRPVPSVPVRCVQVENPEHLYLAGRAMIPTHNSLFGENSGTHAALNGEPVYVASMEMSDVEWTQRTVAQQARVNLQSLRTGRLSEAELQRVDANFAKINDLPVRISDGFNQTLADIRAGARDFKREMGGLGLIVVDQVSLITARDPSMDLRRQFGESTRALKKLARELDVPIMLLAQIRRAENVEAIPTMNDLKESGDIEENSDVVLLLHWSKKEPEVLSVVVEKQRAGPKGVIVKLQRWSHYALLDN